MGYRWDACMGGVGKGGQGRQHTLELRYLHSVHNLSVISLQNSLPYTHLVYTNLWQLLLPANVDISVMVVNCNNEGL